MRRVVLTMMALALVLALAGCQMQPVRTMDNGAAGAEGWNVPVPVWPWSQKAPCVPEGDANAAREGR